MKEKFRYLGQNTEFEKMVTMDALETLIFGLETSHSAGGLSSVQNQKNYKVQTFFPKKSGQSYEISITSGNNYLSRLSFSPSFHDAHLRALKTHFTLVEKVSGGNIPKDEEISDYFKLEY